MPSHLTAPPLTADNVMKVVEGVNWRTLCEELLGYVSPKFGMTILVTPDDIQAKHQSDEACLKAVVEIYLHQADDCRRSWRKLIWTLYETDHVSHAEHIRSYAEPLRGGSSWITSLVITQ